MYPSVSPISPEVSHFQLFCKDFPCRRTESRIFVVILQGKIHNHDSIKKHSNYETENIIFNSSRSTDAASSNVGAEARGRQVRLALQSSKRHGRDRSACHARRTADSPRHGDTEDGRGARGLRRTGYARTGCRGALDPHPGHRNQGSLRLRSQASRSLPEIPEEGFDAACRHLFGRERLQGTLQAHRHRRGLYRHRLDPPLPRGSRGDGKRQARGHRGALGHEYERNLAAHQHVGAEATALHDSRKLLLRLLRAELAAHGAAGTLRRGHLRAGSLSP